MDIVSIDKNEKLKHCKECGHCKECMSVFTAEDIVTAMSVKDKQPLQ